MVWTLQDAKNRFSEVVERAHREGPQRVTKYGKDAVMIVSVQDWSHLHDAEQSIADFFLKSPLAGSGLDTIRDTSPVRAVEL